MTSKKLKGAVHLSALVVIIILAVWALIFYVLISKGIIKKPSFLKKEPKVELKTEYKNPFEKETQYVNPFDKYKNPFNNL